MIYTHNQKYLIGWLAKRNQWSPSERAIAIANVDSNGSIRGVVGIDNWNGASCEMHMAGSTGWLTRSVLRTSFTYAFDELKCNKIVIGLINPKPELMELELRIGFKVEHVIEDAAPGGGLVLVTMDRASCKWLEN